MIVVGAEDDPHGSKITETVCESESHRCAGILGQHRGIQSLGYVMSMGLATCMIVGLTFLPALLNLVLLFRTRKEEAAAKHA